MIGNLMKQRQKQTIWRVDPAVGIVDEAHMARKYNFIHRGIRYLQEKSWGFTALTATPVTTDPDVSTVIFKLYYKLTIWKLRTFGFWVKQWA